MPLDSDGQGQVDSVNKRSNYTDEELDAMREDARRLHIEIHGDDCTFTFIYDDITEQEPCGQETAFNDWVESGKSLASKYIASGFQWAIGDWLNQYPLPPEVGNAYDDGERILDIPKRTLYDWASTAKRMPLSVRVEKKLSFTHHRAIANAEPDADEVTKKRWVDTAIDEGWSVSALSKAIRRSRVTGPTFNLPKSFIVKIPRHAFETLHDIARGRKSTDQKVAAQILVEHLSSDEVKAQAALELEKALEKAKERTRRRRQRMALAIDRFGLQR